MLTPQEVQDKKFVKAVFGGYDMATVDEFLEELTNDYTALFKENTVLKNKLKVLVDTVEEYRTVDESMRRALLGAQKIAHNMVQEAKQKSEKLLDSANKSAQTRRQELDNELLAEKRRLEAVRQQTTRFTEVMKSQFAKQIELLEALPQIEVADPDESANRMDSNAREIDENLHLDGDSELVSDEAGDIAEGGHDENDGGEAEAENDGGEAEAAEEGEAGTPNFGDMSLAELEAYGQARNDDIEDDTELFEIKLPSNLKELPDDALQVEDTGEIETPIDYDKLQFGDNFKVGK